jgi:hypothetical protein
MNPREIADARENHAQRERSSILVSRIVARRVHCGKVAGVVAK